MLEVDSPDRCKSLKRVQEYTSCKFSNSKQLYFILTDILALHPLPVDTPKWHYSERKLHLKFSRGFAVHRMQSSLYLTAIFPSNIRSTDPLPL
jgi:hypothetical protein